MSSKPKQSKDVPTPAQYLIFIPRIQRLLLEGWRWHEWALLEFSRARSAPAKALGGGPRAQEVLWHIMFISGKILNPRSGLWIMLRKGSGVAVEDNFQTQVVWCSKAQAKTGQRIWRQAQLDVGLP